MFLGRPSAYGLCDGHNGGFVTTISFLLFLHVTQLDLTGPAAAIKPVG
jgi:hypothetical protein